jgi:pyruvate dehydrogenase E2 component (dihydrolipoamide acetyltransferase)
MPQLGLTMTEGSVTNWLKKPGDHVERGEPLFTVETDKVEMDVESTRDGYVNSILLETGEVVQVGTIIASLVDEESEVGTKLEAPAPSPAASAAQKENKQPRTRAGKTNSGGGSHESTNSAPRGGEYPVSPRARSLAKSLGVDVAKIVPAGARVVEEDVRLHMLKNDAKAGNAPASTRSSRAVIAKRTAASFQTAPHFYLSAVANADAAVKLRESLAAKSEKEIGVRLTYTDLFLKALAIALREQPAVNSQWRDDTIVAGSSVDVGFAVQGPEALLIPVLKNADTLSLIDLAKRRHELTTRARQGALTLGETEGGSATLSNLGTFDIDWFEAILNTPQSVLLSTGRIAKRPVVMDDRLAVASTVVLTLSVDHRVLDGAAAAGFLQRVKNLIEQPNGLLL